MHEVRGIGKPGRLGLQVDTCWGVRRLCHAINAMHAIKSARVPGDTSRFMKVEGYRSRSLGGAGR